jgi:hypothetical protein
MLYRAAFRKALKAVGIESLHWPVDHTEEDYNFRQSIRTAELDHLIWQKANWFRPIRGYIYDITVKKRRYDSIAVKIPYMIAVKIPSCIRTS